MLVCTLLVLTHLFLLCSNKQNSEDSFNVNDRTYLFDLGPKIKLVKGKKKEKEKSHIGMKMLFLKMIVSYLQKTKGSVP